MKVVLGALPKTIESVFLPPASLDDLPQGLATGAKVALTMTRSMPSLRHVLKSLASTTRLVALVIDPYGSDAIDVAKEFNVESYIFFTSTAMALSFLLHFPKLDESAPCGFRFSELQEPLRLPGCLPFRSKDLMDDALHGRNNENYKWLLYHSKRLHLVKGIMVNTFMELEAGAIKALHQESHDGEEGERLRNNMKHLKDAAAKVVREGGSSTRALSELASKWKRQADNEFEMA
ncbi:hydroquinone glucosyltransferase [Fagus crenata]